MNFQTMRECPKEKNEEAKRSQGEENFPELFGRGLVRQPRMLLVTRVQGLFQQKRERKRRAGKRGRQSREHGPWRSHRVSRKEDNPENLIF